MKQVYRTYGRHRHRVVSVDIWGDKYNPEVFSFSSDTQNETNSISHAKSSTRDNAGSHLKKTRKGQKKDYKK